MKDEVEDWGYGPEDSEMSQEPLTLTRKNNS